MTVKTKRGGVRHVASAYAAIGLSVLLAVCCCDDIQASQRDSRTEAIRTKLLSDDRNYVFVAMHRGDWRNYPENSRGAIESCIALGADIVELDVRKTKDGRFVLLHDDSLDRTTDGHGKVSQHLFSEVKALHLKMGMGGKDARVTDCPVMSLEEALELTHGRILVNIDKFTLHPREILEVVDKVGALKEVLVKSTLSAADARALFGDYWKRVESGELLYMPIVQLGGKQEPCASEILPGYIALEPRPASMYEVCLKDEASVPKLDAVRMVPSRPRIWINMMWDGLAAGRGEADHALPKGRVLRLTDPDAVWGRALGWGATMLQSDYGAELLVYLNRVGRHDITK